jgi:hypothetical protein
MPITVQRAKAAVLLACGGDPSTATGMTVDARVAEIVNSAGQQLFHHNWTWRERSSNLTLDFVQNQKHVTLPTDSVLNEVLTSTIIRVFPVNNNFRTFTFVSPEKFTEFEARNLNITEGMRYLTITRPESDFGTGTATDLRLEVYPTPTANETDVVGIKYRRDFPTVRSTDVNGSDTTANPQLLFELPIPESAIPLFLEYLRAFGEGGEYGDTSQRVAAVEAGPLYDQAMRHDGTTSPNYGPLPLAVRGKSSYAGLQFFPNGNIPDPS